ncbi:hypothetical protein [Devosia sp.]|uniref:hypothetical protein n=1 Tax=Devosia sp. TaxID=1871048 RepID=UPI002FCB46E3
MTKDGRPSLITNIRLFAGARRDHKYIKGQEGAVAYGRRLAWYLRSLQFSLGAYPELYVLFNPSVAAGDIELLDEPRGESWWHRYVQVGVPPDFLDGRETLELITQGIVEVLVAVRPDQAEMIRNAGAVVSEHGSRLRFMIKRRETKKLVVEISSNIEVWPKPSQLFISHTDKATGIYREADPIDLGFYLESLALASGIRLQDAVNLKGFQTGQLLPNGR